MRKVIGTMQPIRENGFTLVELLVAMAIAFIVMSVVVSAYFVQVRGKNTQEVLTDMNDASRAALEIMINEIRMAGFDPLGTAGAAVVTATANQLGFTMDIGNDTGSTLNPDGALSGPNEQVRYAISGTGNLGRATGTAGVLQPLIRNVDALNFVYLDSNGNILATPVTGSDLNDIRTIQVTIVARTQGGLTGAHTDSTAYENQQGTVVYTALNDSFRRLLLTTNVTCRNLNMP